MSTPRSAEPTLARAHGSIEFEPASRVRRLGLIALATDLTSERDYHRVVPGDTAAVHVARVAYENPTTPENLARMGDRLAATAGLLEAVAPLDAVCYSCTAASVVLGDERVEAAVQSRLPGTPVVTPSRAACQALAALGARRIAVLTPYLEETSRPFADYFERAGFEIVRFECLGLDDDRQMARVTAADLIAAATAIDRPSADALFLSCTALPALGVIDEIEHRLRKPVVSSNQATLWSMLGHAGVAPAGIGLGRLLDTASPVGYARDYT